MDSQINIQNPNNIDYSMDDIFQKISELPPLESFFEIDSFVSQQNNSYGFEEMMEIKVDNSALLQWNWNEEPLKNEYEKEKQKRGIFGRKRSLPVLELKEIQQHFDKPITRAAREMNVGLTVLKKRCRELNIMRWPHRKIKSLKALINNVKEMGLSDEVEMLEEHRRLVEEVPDLDLDDRTKKLRQACFKANYKKKRCSLPHA